MANHASVCAPASPRENGYIESLNARLRNELLNGETFYTSREDRIIEESWYQHYNIVRLHGALGWKPPAPEVFIFAFPARADWQPQLATPPRASNPTVNVLTFQLDPSLGLIRCWYWQETALRSTWFEAVETCL